MSEDVAPESDLHAKLREHNIAHVPLENTSLVTYSKDTVYVDVPPGLLPSQAVDDLQTALDFADREKLLLHIHSRLGQLEYLEAAIFRKRPDALWTSSVYELEVSFQERHHSLRQTVKTGIQGNSISNNIGSWNKTIMRFYFQFRFGPSKDG